MTQVPALREAMLERGWSAEAVAFIADKVLQSPKDDFSRFLIGKYTGVKVRKPSLYKRPPLPRSLIKQVFERDAYRCQHCDGWIDLCVDHIHPYSKGGTSELDNLQTLCRPCNSKKKDRI